MCAGGSAHEKRQRVMRLVMQSNALKPFKKNLGIIRCEIKKENENHVSNFIVIQNANILRLCATHFFIT
jgi:hypothetical protein